MRHLLILLIVLFSALITSCMKDEEYTTSPNDVLYFSTDTVAFDTIISGSATNTYTFTVYNRAKKALRIPKVMLQGGSSSPFAVNVDGEPLINGVAEDFEIGSKDSMIVFLMANLPESESDEPVPAQDKLVFTTAAGVNQEVVLTAAGQSVVPISQHRVTTDTIWQARKPYRIMDSLMVEEGKTLTLAAGTRLYFHDKAELIVKGCLKVEGTAEKPVVLRGDRLGYMFAGQPYDRIPGQWGGIRLTHTSYDNHINFADIHSGNFGIRVDSADISRNKLLLENSIVHNTTHHALDIYMAQVKVGNSQITNAGGDCLHVRGGDVSLTHCTIARFFVFTGGQGTAINFANYEGSTRLPLQNLTLQNCIVTGYLSDEIMGSPNPNYKKDAFNYAFKNCLVNTPKVEDSEGKNPFVGCQWDVDGKDTPTADDGTHILREKNFTPEPNLDDLTFSFELSPSSKAVGKADANITANTYTHDRLGRPRGNMPDMGCYQHTVKKPETEPKQHK